MILLEFAETFKESGLPRSLAKYRIAINLWNQRVIAPTLRRKRTGRSSFQGVAGFPGAIRVKRRAFSMPLQ